MLRCLIIGLNFIGGFYEDPAVHQDKGCQKAEQPLHTVSVNECSSDLVTSIKSYNKELVEQTLKRIEITNTAEVYHECLRKAASSITELLNEPTSSVKAKKINAIRRLINDEVHKRGL